MGKCCISSPPQETRSAKILEAGNDAGASSLEETGVPRQVARSIQVEGEKHFSMGVFLLEDVYLQSLPQLQDHGERNLLCIMSITPFTTCHALQLQDGATSTLTHKVQACWRR